MEPLLSGLSTFFPRFINYSIDISILICLIFIIKSIATKKLPAWWHYSLWIILLLRMIFPFKFENSPLNIPSIVPISIDESLFESVLIEENIVASNLTPELSSGTHGWNIQVDDMLLFLWLACAIIFGVYILLKNIKFQNDIKKEPVLTDKKVLVLLEECKNRMKIRTTLKINITDKIKSPALFGYIRPRLLLPVGIIEKLDYVELSYIFMHELGHLKRHDIGVSWIMTFLQIFQWFNPFVWVAFHQMRIDQESACDASVLSRIKHHHTIDYASTIVGFLENFCQNRKLPAMVGILENQAQIKKRITMIVNYRRYSKTMMLFSTTLLLIVGVIFFSFVGFVKANHEQPGLDSSVFQILPLEVSKDLMAQDKDAIDENEVVSVAEDIQNASVISQERDEKDEVAQEETGSKTQVTMVEAQDTIINDNKETIKSVEVAQNALIAIQERVVKDEIVHEKPDNETKVTLFGAQNFNIKNEPPISSEITQNASVISKESVFKDEIVQVKHGNAIQKVLVKTQGININNEKEAVRFTENDQKDSAETLKLAKEITSPSSEAKDIQEYYPVVESSNQQLPEAIPLSQKMSGTIEEKGINYMGLAGIAFNKPEKMNTTEGTIALIEKKPDESKMHGIKAFDEQPKIVKYYPPIYPFKARAKGIEGRVLLRFIVDKAGYVQNPEVVSAEPEGVFEQAALDTVVNYKLKPAIKDGESVSSIVKLAISFSINDNYLRFAQR